MSTKAAIAWFRSRWTGGTVPLMNIAVGLKVIAGLSSIMLVMALAASRFGDNDR